MDFVSSENSNLLTVEGNDLPQKRSKCLLDYGLNLKN